jgi:hypothetical protein
MANKRSWSSKYLPESNPTRVKLPDDVSKYFSSWSSFLEYLQDPSIVPKSAMHCSNEREDSLTESENLDDAISISRKGYAKIVPGIMERITEIDHLLHKNETEEYLFMDTYSPLGIYDMGAVCSGCPENAINITELESDDKNGNTVVVNFDATVSGSYSGEEITNRGSAVVALIYALGMSGYAVQVNTVVQIKDIDHSVKIAVVRVKEYSDALDMPALAFQLAHPSMLRRLGFKFLEIEGIKCSGYGRPVNSQEIGFVSTMPKDEVFISGDFPSDNYSTVEESAAFIKAKIEEVSNRYR